MVHYRITPEGKFLKKEDYKVLKDGTVYGFGLDTYHYLKVCEARKKRNIDIAFDHLFKWPLPLREEFYESWDAREGHNIEGKKLNTRHHPLHDKILLELETGNRYEVDAVHKQHYLGFYTALLIRQEGSKSHGVIYWENDTCKDPNIIEGIEESQQRFKLIDK